ncbi:hypothetical protein Btru_074469 [Bulinus truncatus]|nr:hypothetical protein Btru_074469 [Bulinus truncatus]
MYLELVYNSHEWNAAEFHAKFWQDQDEYHHEDLARLACVRKKSTWMEINCWRALRTSGFVFTHVSKFIHTS